MLMNVDIEKKKQLLDLPFEKNQLEYWGPVNNQFADAFLTMANNFISSCLDVNDLSLRKGVFSSFVEMVQNVAEYNEERFVEDLPQSFIKLKINKNSVVINTANLIATEDLSKIEEIFGQLFLWEREELDKNHRDRLLAGGSLGLIMLRRLKNADFEYQLDKNKLGENWLSLELKINYGSTKD
jgi:hypothetical protein